MTTLQQEHDDNRTKYMKGDIKARPVKLGPGGFTATYGPSDFETTDGQPINFDTY